MDNGLDRRKFVFSLAAMVFAPPATLLRPAVPASTTGLSDTDRALLNAVCDQIVPADEFPGAVELGVVTFIERLLAEAHPEWVGVYQAGLQALESASRRVKGAGFSELQPSGKKEFLESVQRGELADGHWTGEAQQGFFDMVLSHTMNGYYGHPEWGGNKGRKAWAMIGYDDWWA